MVGLWKHGATLAFVAVVILALSYVGIIVASDFESRDVRVRDETRDAVNDFRSATESYFATYEAALRGVGETACVRSRGALPCGDLFERLNLRFPSVVNFAAFDRKGMFFASGQPFPRSGPPTVARLAFFDALAKEGRTLYVMDPHTGPVSGELVTGLVVALEDGKRRFDGGIGVSLRFDELMSIWMRVRAAPDIGAAVFDRHGKVIFSTPEAAALADLTEAERQQVLNRLGRGEGELEIGRGRFLFQAAVVPGNDWTVVATHPGPYGVREYLADSPLLPRLLLPTLLLAGIGLVLSFRDWRRAFALETKVVERTAALTASNRQLARTNAELETFAYVASHDLREPLRTVSTYVTLLERRYADHLDDDGRTFVRYAREAAQRMNNLVLDLLDYARVGVDGGPPVMLSSRRAALAEVVALDDLIRETGAQVTVAEEMPDLLVDPADLARLFHNLIENAVIHRHPERSPAVTVSAEAGPAGWVFQVADNGVGIEPQYFDKIFVLFQRLRPATNPAATGIGLTICRKVVEHYGGRIWVTSTVGEGSRFHFTLPDARPRRMAADTLPPA